MSLQERDIIRGIPENPWAPWRTPTPGHLTEAQSCSIAWIAAPTAPRPRTLVGLEVPPPLAPLADEIERSRQILDLEDNFDGEGSPAYSLDTWERATRFLLANAVFAFECLDIVPPVPDITPGPQGSIDIFWQSRSQELLLNVPADPSARASYYGDDRDASVMKGWLTTEDRSSTLLLLLYWLA